MRLRATTDAGDGSDARQHVSSTDTRPAASETIHGRGAWVFDAHEACGTVPGAASGSRATRRLPRLVGGANTSTRGTLRKRYETLVDPRLDHQQSLEWPPGRWYLRSAPGTLIPGNTPVPGLAMRPRTEDFRTLTASDRLVWRVQQATMIDRWTPSSASVHSAGSVARTVPKKPPRIVPHRCGESRSLERGAGLVLGVTVSTRDLLGPFDTV